MMRSFASHKCNYTICRKRLENDEMKREREFICKVSKRFIMSKNSKIAQKCHLNLHLRIVVRDTRNLSSIGAMNK